MSTPSFTALVDWLEGRLDPERAEQVAGQVAAGDDELRAQVAWIRDFLSDVDGLRLEQPPADLRARLRQSFVGMHRPRAIGTWTDAVLLHDSRATLAPTGTRAATDGISLAFDSDLGRIALQVQSATPGRFDLEGLLRLIGDDTPRQAGDGVEIALLEAGVLRRATRADRNGRFELTDVATSIDEMWLSAGETRVRIGLDLDPD